MAHSEPFTLQPNQARYFRDEFRKARAAAAGDAEDFQQILFVLERLGSLMYNQIGTLKSYCSSIQNLAEKSSLAKKVPTERRDWHTPFPCLYSSIQGTRNEGMHQGAFVRHLTTHLVQLSLVLEDALQIIIREDRELKKNDDKVCDYMVRDPVHASEWQPISFLRQQILINSFSYLPFFGKISKSPDPERWWLVSDHAIAQYLHSTGSYRDRLLIRSLRSAIDGDNSEPKLKLEDVDSFYPNDTLDDVINKMRGGKPVLIVSKENKSDLSGILTPFDLL